MEVSLPQGGNVIGVGIDLVEVSRIRGSHERHGERFMERVFTEGEQAYCLDMKNPYPHLAARFAAKEAVSKAFSTGIGRHLGWKAIEVVKGQRQQPFVRLDEQGSTLLKEVGGSDVLISLSHTLEHATAVAVIVK